MKRSRMGKGVVLFGVLLVCLLGGMLWYQGKDARDARKHILQYHDTKLAFDKAYELDRVIYDKESKCYRGIYQHKKQPKVSYFVNYWPEDKSGSDTYEDDVVHGLSYLEDTGKQLMKQLYTKQQRKACAALGYCEIRGDFQDVDTSVKTAFFQGKDVDPLQMVQLTVSWQEYIDLDDVHAMVQPTRKMASLMQIKEHEPLRLTMVFSDLSEENSIVLRKLPYEVIQRDDFEDMLKKVMHEPDAYKDTWGFYAVILRDVA